MKIRAFITHKKAEHFNDCQDRFSINADTKSVALSDGMSQSWQQKIWAQLLVDTFCSSNDWNPSLKTVGDLSPIWRKKVEDYIQTLRATNAKENIIYRNERYLAEGESAGATLVGVRFDSYKWECNVLGDSCLITKDGSEYKFGTSQDTEKFDNNPDFYDSDSRKQGKGEVKKINGVLSSENPFILLVSDPFSDFLLEHKKQSDIETFVNQLLSIKSHNDFEFIVGQWRELGMHNDDSTLIIIEYDGNDDWSILHQDDLNTLLKSNEVVTEKSVPINVQETKNTQLVDNFPNFDENIISFDEFKEYFIKKSEKVFRSYNWLKHLIAPRRNKAERMKIVFEKIAKQIFDQYEIRKK